MSRCHTYRSIGRLSRSLKRWRTSSHDLIDSSRKVVFPTGIRNPPSKGVESPWLEDGTAGRGERPANTIRRSVGVIVSEAGTTERFGAQDQNGINAWVRHS